MTRSRTCQLFAFSVLSLALHDAHAACSFSPTPGDDSYVCDSDSAPSLIDLSGNNALTLPANSSGTINGPVTFGAGADRITVHGGLITGAVIQGDGIDDFVMTGGQVQSLAQGDGRDTFLMTGGTIVGAFEDGDVAKMTGGSIGRVDMKLDNNIFDMSGGNITGNLVTAFGRDTIILSGGSIGGNISVSGGDDSVTVTGGTVGGEIRLSVGDDRFVWRDAGTLKGAVLMGDGNDTAVLGNLTETLLSSTPAIDGGPGADKLSVENSSPESGARYINWETINLAQTSSLTLNDTLTLGDSTTGTGVLTLDATSRIGSSQGVINAYASGQKVSVNNAGLIDLTSSGTSVTDQLTIAGNYTGDGARLNLQSVLAGDNAPSDRLIVSTGTISGTTSINVTNAGGMGALTTQNGIQVVEANQGAVSSADAFTLGRPLSAGAYQYYLFKGGVTAGSENSWYLRSSVVAPSAVAAVPQQPTPEQPTPQQPLPVPPPTPAMGTPPLPVAAPGESIVLYRQEVPLYAVVPPVAALLAQTTLGTFHERQGDQNLLREDGALPGGWVRAFGNSMRQSWSGTVTPSFDGSINGYQVGHDLYGYSHANGYRQRAGLFVSHARLDGDVRGFNLGFKDNKAGDVRLDGDSLGAYWTLIGPQSAYLDVVALGTRFDGRSRSERGVKLDLDGHGVSLSVEAGYPLALTDRWKIEPQAQIIGQRVKMDSAQDGISNVGFDTQDYLKGRVGARLKGAYEIANVPVEPYVRTNLWRSFGGNDTTRYDAQPVTRTDHTSSTMDIGAGIVARLHPGVSVYASTDYSANIDSRNQEGLSGSLGLRVSW